MRKIIQIAVSEGSKGRPQNLFALCDDGTVWQSNAWELVWKFWPAIPQELKASPGSRHEKF